MFPSPNEVSGSKNSSSSTFELDVYNAVRQWNGTSIRVTVPPRTPEADISAMRRELGATGWETSVTEKGGWKYLDIDAAEPTGT